MYETNIDFVTKGTTVVPSLATVAMVGDDLDDGLGDSMDMDTDDVRRASAACKGWCPTGLPADGPRAQGIRASGIAEQPCFRTPLLTLHLASRPPLPQGPISTRKLSRKLAQTAPQATAATAPQTTPAAVPAGPFTCASLPKKWGSARVTGVSAWTDADLTPLTAIEAQLSGLLTAYLSQPARVRAARRWAPRVAP